ncbi:broad-spectrum mercury transporter MerE [Stenotrophomonas maltophilia]|uniref:broad-spectrum mercury transporter MerE n=1 Tax=Stenotrophomonas maltophilia TaxID=40324 RepID=UPI003D18B5A5
MARSLPHQAKQSATESANAARPGAISRLRAWGWGALAVLSCPCHLPVLALLLSGTAAGAFLDHHLGMTALAFATLFVVSLICALRAIPRHP